MSARDPLDVVLAGLQGVKQSGDGYTAKCPAHEDAHASLSIGTGEQGQVLLHCHKGCTVEAVAAALGLTLSDLWPSTEDVRPVERRYEIRGVDGALWAYHQRVDKADGKIMWWTRPDGTRGLGGIHSVDLPLYGVERLAALAPGATVVVTEGEKAADAITKWGIAAVGTVTGAAATPTDLVLEPLHGFDVVLWPDNDAEGANHMTRIAERLTTLGTKTRIVSWPDAPPKADAADASHVFGAAAISAAAPWGPTVPTMEEMLVARFYPIKKRENESNDLALVELSALLAEPDEQIPYVVDGLLPVAGTSVCGAKPKVGKSTLARNLALCVARGEPFFGRATTQGPVIYLALEEKRSEVARHFRQMGATTEPIVIHVGTAPEDALPALALAIGRHHPILTIIDPLFKLVRVTDVNDYAIISRALEPLATLAAMSGCHIHLVHHVGKGERLGGDALLGSTAIFGGVDSALIMRKHDDARVIESIGRYGVDLPETIVTLDQATGRINAGGDPALVLLLEQATKVTAALATEDLEEATIRQKVGGNTGLTGKAIRHLMEHGEITRHGKGRKGDPFRYTRRRPSTPEPDDDDYYRALFEQEEDQ